MADLPIGIDATMIVKFCMLLIIGLVIISSIGANSLSSTNSVTFTFTNIPNDGDTVQLDGHVYEFDNNGSVTAGHIAVTIGATRQATVDNFKTVAGSSYGVV